MDGFFIGGSLENAWEIMCYVCTAFAAAVSYLLTLR